MKVLVIEDDQDIREEVVAWLNYEGYHTLQAMDGQAGLDMALAEQPDLVISDITMPEMNGYRVLAEMRTHPATALTPVIFLTARATRRDIRYGMEMGAGDYLTKPFTNEELMGAVKAQLAKSKLMRQHTDKQITSLRTTLTHTLNHELRTPLVGILGFGELLTMDADRLSTDQIREMGGAIVRSGRRLHRLVENYLLYAQIQNSAISATAVKISKKAKVRKPDRSISQACDRIAYTHHRVTDLRLSLGGGHSAIRTSEIDLTKIITEVVDNAFKFSQLQAPVEVRTRHVGDRYQIEIIDYGRGMTAEQISQISAYQQFERTLYEQQGLGLGLVLAKWLIELYDGTFAIHSVPQEQTTVTLTFDIYAT